MTGSGGHLTFTLPIKETKWHSSLDNRAGGGRDLKPESAIENDLTKHLSGRVNTQPWWGYLASLQRVVLQLGQEKEGRLCLGESQRLGRWQEVRRLCGGGKSKRNVRQRNELGYNRRQIGTFLPA